MSSAPRLTRRAELCADDRVSVAVAFTAIVAPETVDPPAGAVIATVGVGSLLADAHARRRPWCARGVARYSGQGMTAIARRARSTSGVRRHRVLGAEIHAVQRTARRRAGGVGGRRATRPVAPDTVDPPAGAVIVPSAASVAARRGEDDVDPVVPRLERLPGNVPTRHTRMPR